MKSKRNSKKKFPTVAKQLVIVANHRYEDSGADKLKQGLKCNLLKPDKLPKVTLSSNCKVINWGSSRFPIWAKENHYILNEPGKVLNAINKLFCLRRLKEAKVATLDFFTNDKEATRAALENDLRIFCRTRLTGHSGEGILIYNSTDKEIPPAPLYTLEFPKTHEYRVHVFKGNIIDRAQKKTMGEDKLQEHKIPEIVKTIRNLKNGWFYSKENLLYDSSLDQLAIDAVNACGLDFGAVDILSIWGKPDKNNERKLKRAVVCEINTAPGLEAPSTLEAYVKAFKEYGGIKS